ncbi:MAG: DUF5329 domain-containing protein [Lysobacter sp.]|nr:DUF5329 domain-containing protein [Lysobacter sp.]
MRRASRGVRFAVFATALGFAVSSTQAAPTAQAEREIHALIAGLGVSGCRFERNGDWHDAAAAEAHLQKKYDYLRKRDMADTAELFIERAASRSSLSGKAYRVRCGRDAPVESATWFKRKLAEIRAGSGR